MVRGERLKISPATAPSIIDASLSLSARILVAHKISVTVPRNLESDAVDGIPAFVFIFADIREHKHHFVGLICPHKKGFKSLWMCLYSGPVLCLCVCVCVSEFMLCLWHTKQIIYEVVVTHFEKIAALFSGSERRCSSTSLESFGSASHVIARANQLTTAPGARHTWSATPSVAPWSGCSRCQPVRCERCVSAASAGSFSGAPRERDRDRRRSLFAERGHALWMWAESSL